MQTMSKFTNESLYYPTNAQRKIGIIN